MPKTWIAQEVRGITKLSFVVEAQDIVSRLEVTGEVSDGESWRPLALDLWSDLNATQKAQMQALYTKLKTAYQQRMLA